MQQQQLVHILYLWPHQYFQLVMLHRDVQLDNRVLGSNVQGICLRSYIAPSKSEFPSPAHHRNLCNRRIIITTLYFFFFLMEILPCICMVLPLYSLFVNTIDAVVNESNPSNAAVTYRPWYCPTLGDFGFGVSVQWQHHLESRVFPGTLWLKKKKILIYI